MLGKTAGGLFWMCRLLERAENTARLVGTGQRIALTRSAGSDEDWASVLKTAGAYDAFMAKGAELTKDTALDWMLRAKDNPSSVLSLFKQARDNARLVRTAITHEVWEAVNSSWMQIETALKRKINERELSSILELIRHSTSLVRGTTHGTMLRNDIYDFARLGTFIERADNTGRILDVKYYVLLPTAFSVGSSLDNAQWETILLSLGAGGGFRMVYGQDTKPPQVVEFMVLDRRMPRSLNFCCDKIAGNLGYLANDYGTELPSKDMAEKLAAQIAAQSLDAIFDHGLHEYIQSVLGALADVSRQIEIDYRFYE